MAARVHLLCGLVGAGKTTYAKQLAVSLPAVRFSLDEWMLRLHGLAYDEPEYALRVDDCKALIWDTAVQVLRLGNDVVLDWNQWNRERRAYWKSKAEAAGVEGALHFLDVALEVAITRATQRESPSSHPMVADAVRHAASIFEPPAKNEGLEITHVHR